MAKKNFLNLGDIFIGLTLILGIILIINIILTFSLNRELAKSAEAIKEKSRPAKIEIALVRNPKCSDCFDASRIISEIKNRNVNVTKESSFDFDSKQGKEMISKYKIEKIPAVIVTGEIDRISIEGLEKKEGSLILANINPPYTNANTGKIEGKVSIYILKDFLCGKCANFTALVNDMKRSGIRISDEKNVDSGSSEGKQLIAKYNIGFVPTIIISREASAYPIMRQAWSRLGSIENDGSYVMRLVTPPYVNLTTGKLRGLVNAVYLADKSCAECYDVSVNRQILANPQSFAMRFDKEETLDVTDAKGKELIAKYNITQVPTIILSDEAGAYPSSQGLQQFFSVEKDGSYVFRKLSVFGAYKDLLTSQIVKAPQ